MTAVILALPLACHVCGRHCKRSGCGTGYGIDRENRRVCYDCCAVADREEMVSTGKYAGLYLTENRDQKGAPFYVTNWPGTLRFAVYGVRKSWHNFAGRDGRRDCWFNGPDGHVWHFVSIGHGDIGSAKRTREVWRKREAC